MPSSHVVVHYHRPRGDYDAWHIALFPARDSPPTAIYSAALRHARTSFGTVFRIPRAHLPTTPFIAPCQPHSSKTDSLPRPFSSHAHHIFLLQSSSETHQHPSPFNPIAITTSIPQILSVYHQNTVRHIFPPSPPYRHPALPILYLLFSYPIQSELRLEQCQHTHQFSPIPQSNAPVIHTSTSPQFLTLSDEPLAITHANYDIRHLVIAQAAQKPHASKCLPATNAFSPYPTISHPVHPLTVYCHTFTAAQPETLIVRCLKHNPAPPVSPTSPYHGQLAFTVQLSKLPAQVIEEGLEITPDPPSHKPLTWTPDLGLHVIHAETFDHLLPATHVDNTFMYHRYGDTHDWENWELHVWIEETDDYPARSMMSRAEKPCVEGVLVFHLLSAVFPAGATVHAQPVRMKLVQGDSYINEYGETITPEPYRDADRRDIVRTWQSGKPTARVMHFVQGDNTIYSCAPNADDMQANRRFRLRYRRFEPDDYKDWDLWTWDDSDPEKHRLAVPVSSSTRAWADFVVDRANYGAGQRISIIPRHGANEWTEKDDPLRVWDAELLKGSASGLQVALPSTVPQRLPETSSENVEEDTLPTFLIVQGASFILRHLEEVKSMLRAFVDREQSVIISAPVPIGWIYPPRRGRRRPIEDATLLLFDTNAYDLLDDTALRYDLNGGRNLRFSKIQTVSHTESRVIFSKEVVTFLEDFLVENVIVSVPGFEKVVLTWEYHVDWDKYYYPGTLGWEYTREATSFRCFAPTADQVGVVLYSSPTGKAGRTLVPMRRIPNGCWKAIVDCDIKGRFYKLLAEGENKRLFPGVEVIDPYSRCNTAHTGRGLIFGTETTKIHQRPDVKPMETIVYELHVRDATIDKESGVSRRGKFIGLTERGTRRKSRSPSKSKALTPWGQENMPGAVYENCQQLDKDSTGLDHIVQMGVNAIQILPIQDFDNDEKNDEAYRWGYMPVHFNSPDGWYASETQTEARVTEFKKLVDAIHKVGLKVIMDVVYNHTAEDSNEYNLEARFSFNGLAPRYYYRTCGNTPVAHNGDTTCGLRKPQEPRCGACYSNGSGCGNEFRSESPMGRKFIVDSLKYWASEYMVDGFRFDLLGLIDVDTLAQAAAELKNIDPNIIIYGEPWSGGLTPIRITDKGMQRSKGFGVFNNTFRDAIRGSPFAAEETFVMDGGRLDEVKGGIVGSIDDFCDKPLETINYVECHDNYTLWDHMMFYTRSRIDDIKFSETDMRRIDRLAAVVVFTSQGIPFMQMGQEMCRTKFGVENSYESPDEINMVRWETKEKEWSTVLYYRGLILLRRSHPEIFCLETADEVRQSVTFYEDLGLAVPARCIAFRIKGNPEKLLEKLKKENPQTAEPLLAEESSKWAEIVVLLNPTPSAVMFELPDGLRDCIWLQVLDATTAGVRTIRGPMIASVDVPGRAAAILRRASEKDTADAQLELRLATVSDSYCIFHSDDPISRYAVGLDSEMSEREKTKHQELKNLRQRFLEKRILRRPGGSSSPSPRATETSAAET